jgi:hypothetical protein
MSKETQENSMDSKKQTVLLVSTVAATVAATATAYYFLSRSRRVVVKAETVQDLLDRCHDQVRSIEARLGELTTA